ncbi:unnamed protein product [Arctia plantaginis]|uniref:Uncharacterized protein n=1 Tax=Arctia plantaginis TaxID=874455 RepID=A0A8S1B1N6_ARCPL|nr:unnamed protein product [Arctia plantaginis]
MAAKKDNSVCPAVFYFHNFSEARDGERADPAQKRQRRERGRGRGRTDCTVRKAFRALKKSSKGHPLVNIGPFLTTFKKAGLPVAIY